MDALQEAVIALKARVDKELERQRRGELTTEAVGGITKLGNLTERVAKLLAAEACSGMRLSLPAELKRAGLTAGAGSYLRLARTIAGSARLSSVLADALIRDVRLDKSSRLLGLVDLRNDNSHSGQTERAEVIRLLTSAKTWMATLPIEP